MTVLFNFLSFVVFELVQLAESCLQDDPHYRPSIATVLQRLDSCRLVRYRSWEANKLEMATDIMGKEREIEILQQQTQAQQSDLQSLQEEKQMHEELIESQRVQIETKQRQIDLQQRQNETLVQTIQTQRQEIEDLKREQQRQIELLESEILSQHQISVAKELTIKHQQEVISSVRKDFEKQSQAQVTSKQAEIDGLENQNRVLRYHMDSQLKAQQEEIRILRNEVEEKQRRHQDELERQHKLVTSLETLRAKDSTSRIITNTEFDCVICFDTGDGVILRGCLHQFCRLCLHDHVINSEDAVIKCPHRDDSSTCDAAISESVIREVISEEELQRLYRRGLRLAENAPAVSFHCRSTNCEGFCFIEDKVKEFVCPICKKQNCLLCKAIHEGMDCMKYQDDLKRRVAKDDAARATQDMLEHMVHNGELMNCPGCGMYVQKKDPSDWIICCVCRTEICWATKGPRWGPNGHGDTSGGCGCRVGGKKCHPLCRNCY